MSDKSFVLLLIKLWYQMQLHSFIFSEHSIDENTF